MSPERHVVDSDDEFLPDRSLLSLEEYLEMQRSIGNETRFRILNTLAEKVTARERIARSTREPVEQQLIERE